MGHQKEITQFDMQSMGKKCARNYSKDVSAGVLTRLVKKLNSSSAIQDVNQRGKHGKPESWFKVVRFKIWSRVWQSYQSILHIMVAKKSVNALTLAPGLTKSQLWQ